MSPRLEPSRRRRPARGMTLVELLIGIVISLLVALAAAASAQLFTASQRQGVGVGSSATSVAGALSALKHDIALSGLGFFGESKFLCDRLNLSVGTRMLADNAVFTPIKITRTASNTDEISVVHADAIAAGSNVKLSVLSDGKTSAQLRSFVPLANPVPAGGESVLLSPAPDANPAPVVRLCTVRSVTASVAAVPDTSPLTLTFGNTGINNQMAFSNQPTYGINDRVTLLGGQLAASTYKVEGGNLVVDQPMNEVSGVVLARNVVAMRAQYGISTGAASTLTGWQHPIGVWSSPGATELAKIVAIRIGIVTRSPTKEKPETPGDDNTCTASTSKPVLFPATAGETVEPGVADWKCYRYRTSIAVVPLRNLVLGM